MKSWPIKVKIALRFGRAQREHQYRPSTQSNPDCHKQGTRSVSGRRLAGNDQREGLEEAESGRSKAR